MKRAATISVVLTATVLALSGLGSPSICCGRYELTVEIDKEFAANVTGISYMGAKRQLSESVITSADEYLAFFGHQDSLEPITLLVGFSYRETLGRTWGDVQEYSDVIVVLQRNDGSRDIHRAAVPHRADTRRIIINAATKIQAYSRPV